jgi:hypothetical protein
MQTLEHTNEPAADLQWLAFLLTGTRQSSTDLALEAVGSDGRDLPDGASRFFVNWMLGWSRKVVIAKALAGVRDELVASAGRIGSKRIGKSSLPTRDWTLDRETSKIQLERALLAIDLFPRCTLLLSVFEGMSMEDAAILLDADLDLVRNARMTALRELTRNLAEMQGWKSTSTMPYVMTSEIQHA